jgi:hypothetical protein
VQIKKTLNDWLNRHFFVKEKMPRLIICMGSALIGVTVGFYLDFSIKADGDFWDGQAAKVIGLMASATTTLIVFFLTCGIYNYYKRFVGKRSSKTGKI